MGVVAPTGASLLLGAHNRAPASGSALSPRQSPPQPVRDLTKLDTPAFLCRAHGEFYRNRSVRNDVIRDAHVAILLSLPKLEHALAHCDSEAQVIALLEQRRPWCCFLSSGGRRALVRLAAEGPDHVRTTLRARVEQLRTANQARTARTLADVYHLPIDVAVYALERLGHHGDGMILRATLDTVRVLPDADRQRAAIDDVASKL